MEWGKEGLSSRRGGVDGKSSNVMKPYWKITLWYLVFGVLWILVSDHIMATLASNIEGLTFLQTAKGWLFVLISGILIFGLSRKSFQEHLEKDREKYSLFRNTIKGVYHILLNYLNQMQVVVMEAERSSDFDKEIIALSKEISVEATEELKKLHNIDPISSENIDTVIYGDMRLR